MDRETRSGQPFFADARRQRDQPHVQLHVQDCEPPGRQGAREPCAGAAALVLDISAQFMTSRPRSLGHSFSRLADVEAKRYATTPAAAPTTVLNYTPVTLCTTPLPVLVASPPQLLPSHYTTWSFASPTPSSRPCPCSSRYLHIPDARAYPHEPYRLSITSMLDIRTSPSLFPCNTF